MGQRLDACCRAWVPQRSKWNKGLEGSKGPSRLPGHGVCHRTHCTVARCCNIPVIRLCRRTLFGVPLGRRKGPETQGAHCTSREHSTYPCSPIPSLARQNATSSKRPKQTLAPSTRLPSTLLTAHTISACSVSPCKGVHSLQPNKECSCNGGPPLAMPRAGGQIMVLYWLFVRCFHMATQRSPSPQRALCPHATACTRCNLVRNAAATAGHPLQCCGRMARPWQVAVDMEQSPWTEVPRPRAEMPPIPKSAATGTCSLAMIIRMLLVLPTRLLFPHIATRHAIKKSKAGPSSRQYVYYTVRYNDRK